ncbi:hybrid signal transduction histidine kinase A isoform X2 [Drosophila nasuta]|uniref:hybrid signal transduction histidine kinase A isoform X2 n=1 Tax=Drosophila nasuta TaxID=42062 RepID=UPI00295E2533|nr:hybrid signal transduction histidine kinase A isoform X2 [Drosophila nasuta]
MEQITQYFEHMDYVSFGVIALPCVIIAVYGFLQVASGLAKGKNDKMQRYNNNGNNNTNSGGKRCTQKYANGNIAAGTTAGNATAATAATSAAAATIANSYQQTNSNNNNSGSKSNNATRKARYNNHNNNNNKRHEAGNAAYNLQQKRSNVVAAGADAQSWHRFVTSSCIEEKFLGQHNPGHRNSTSSEATSEDINSSDEHSGKSKSNRSGSGGANGGSGSGNNAAAGGGSNNSGGKSRSKRQQKAQSALKQSLNRTPAMVPGQVQGQQSQVQQQPLEQQATAKVSGGKCSSSSSKQGKWRNSASCNSGANQKRGSSSSSGSNNKSKQTKCQSGGGNGKSAGNSSSNNHHSGSNHNSNNHHHHSSNSNVNSLTKSSGNYSSSGGSNSSSALSSPGSSPNSSSSSSSGNSSSHSLNSTAATSSWSRNQHKIYRQNANFLVPPLRQYEHIELDDAALQQQLQRYLIEPHLLRVYGFPVESVVHEGAIEIFKCLPHMSFAAAHCMAVTETVMTVINCHDGLNTNNFEEEPTSSSSLSSGSGNEASTSTDSGNISPRSLDSESAGEWSGSECESSNELYCNYDAAPEEERSLAKQCVRCKQDFLVDELSGQYLTRDECSYHWGKYHRCYDGSAWVSRWTCCSSSDESDIGCTRHELHVWTGSVVGVNGPYRDFVHTRPRANGNANGNGQTQTRAVYALDCEMSYTGRGLDVTKVSLVALNGQLVYEHYVRPDADIVDYNTRYSGVTAKDLKSCGVKTLAEVQRDLLELIDADTILIGHGLDNDLRALRLVHNTLIDTSIAFPHSSGFPYRRALRHLTKTHLNREIQSGDGATGHSSFEDSRACMELMLWRVRCELDSDGSWED